MSCVLVCRKIKWMAYIHIHVQTFVSSSGFSSPSFSCARLRNCEIWIILLSIIRFVDHLWRHIPDPLQHRNHNFWSTAFVLHRLCWNPKSQYFSGPTSKSQFFSGPTPKSRSIFQDPFPNLSILLETHSQIWQYISGPISKSQFFSGPIPKSHTKPHSHTGPNPGSASLVQFMPMLGTCKIKGGLLRGN